MKALHCAAHCPELVRGIFLAEPPLYAAGAGLRNERSPFLSLAEAAKRPERQLLEEGWPPVRAKALSMLDPETMTMALEERIFESYDTDELLRQVRCPVWLQHGDSELGSQIYDGEVERACGLLSNYEVVHISGTGHAGWIPEREQLIDAIREFVAAASV